MHDEDKEDQGWELAIMNDPPLHPADDEVLEHLWKHLAFLQWQMRPGEAREIAVMSKRWDRVCMMNVAWIPAGEDSRASVARIVSGINRCWDLEGPRNGHNTYFSGNVVREDDAIQGKRTSNGLVSRITTFPLDFDPIRYGEDGQELRDSDTNKIKCAASDSEKRQSGEVVKFCLHWLMDRYGLRDSDFLFLDSGNGYQVHIAIDLPPEEAWKVEACVVYVSRTLTPILLDRFGKKVVDIDECIHNPGRILRLAATWNCKGVATAERPFRLARVIHAPETPTAFCLKRLLDDAANALPLPVSSRARKPTTTKVQSKRSSHKATGTEVGGGAKIADYLERYHGCNLVGNRCVCPLHAGAADPTSLVILGDEVAYCHSECGTISLFELVKEDNRFETSSEVFRWMEEHGYREKRTKSFRLAAKIEF